MHKTALITGASGGLGSHFARLCAEDGMDLLLVARSKDVLKALKKELETAHGIHVTFIIEDLADPASIDRIADHLRKTPIDLLINNAGFGDYGPFSESDPKRNAEMIQVNVSALTALSLVVLPTMIARKSGRILNVASTAAFQPGPLMAVYYATKAYVLSFSLALSNETKGTGITVTCLCPGPTATGFAQHANLGSSRLFKHGLMDSETVTRIGYRACMRGRSLITTGIWNKIGTFATRFAPRMLAAAVVRRTQAKVG